ncbi:tobamovirus multiplication protein 1-like isoform x1 [Anaeramoeba flamelloides]|uniref:Tobamovirus multiplication protein 1-like isoform x1 n=1 Tax=Anaeramoeba flamelloides TaxID=1746091 RepID=A0AAV8A9K7_9EUKA|nr:tobamovirus multiplication protein 1-like isoform x1 [Anaeramoeba flamelloides]
MNSEEKGIVTVFCLLVPIYFFIILFCLRRAFALSSVDRRISHQIVFQLIIVVVFTLRIIYFILELVTTFEPKLHYSDQTIYINTSASCLFIGSFATITFSFMRMYFMKNNTSSERAKKLTRIFAIILSLYVMFLFLISLLVFETKDLKFGKKFQIVRILISCGYSITGISLLLATFQFVRSYPKNLLQQANMISIKKLWLVVFICTILFFIRIILIIIEASDEKLLNNNSIAMVFMFFGYFLSEQVPAFIITTFIYKRPLKKSKWESKDALNTENNQEVLLNTGSVSGSGSEDEETKSSENEI